jgi:hypothetical protein
MPRNDTRKTSPSRRADATIDWLLDSDPSIRWQALRDLVGAADRTVERERQKVARQGWGARLLAKQGRNGMWAAGSSSDIGLYTPKWISTTYTLLLLRDLGLPPTNRAARASCAILLDRGLRADGGVNFGASARRADRGETCVTGMTLSNVSYFRYDDDRLDTIANHLLERQMSDGGWNCRRRPGTTHSSVHTTISVLEGLRHYELHRGRHRHDIRIAQERGREFLLAHRLFRSHRTGKVIKSEFLRLTFPPRWHYDILRALDYFQSVDAPRDERLGDAIDVVRRKRRADGRWQLDYRYIGKVFFELERVGEPSRWNTLRALRVLSWWDGRESAAETAK